MKAHSYFLAWCYIFSEFSAIPQNWFFWVVCGGARKSLLGLLLKILSYSIIPSMKFFY